MSRLTDALFIAAAIGGAVWTYQIKHEADISAKALNSLRAQIRAEDRKMTLLEADWAIATAPDRLRAVVAAHGDQLNLETLDTNQLSTLDDLPPMRPVPEIDEVQADAGGEDRLTTGSIADLLKRSELLQ